MEPIIGIHCPKQETPASDSVTRENFEPRADASGSPLPVHEYHEILFTRALENPSPHPKNRPSSMLEEGQKIANPAPLGLCAFALTSFVMNLYNVYMPHASASGITVALPLVYGGLAQILVGMWEMAVGNTFGAVTFCSYGSYWIAAAIITWLDDLHITGLNKSDANQAELMMALYLMAWFIFTTLMLLCTLKSSLAMFLLFFFLDMNYLLLGISHLRGAAGGNISTSVGRVGGLFGLLAAFAAWYNALAGVIDINNGFFRVPVGHFPWSPASHAHRTKVKAV
ncbi:hypothetical protein N7492_009684 [Penicillium capsulatum]|uniref:GPR/FUN34 family protein n=1 Tax=Penicillium capsulatum TaxID=69766 RepID=A0A9W9LH33_9EURO|nr:hypothetical protein N7492_009684 [Penicillium capsulatum]KAJ6107070.1 hypothetical protein N7512_010587 [Penicillium capsulatum]